MLHLVHFLHHVSFAVGFPFGGTADYARSDLDRHRGSGSKSKLVASAVAPAEPKFALVLERVRRRHRVGVVFVRLVPIAWWTKLSIARLDALDAAHLGPKTERRE